MTSLILESSSCKASLIVCHEGKVVEKYFFNGGSGLSQNFFLTLEKLGLDWKSLTYIACGIGPGSFTGIRISAAIAQTFAYAHSIPLIPFCSLLAFTPSITGPYFTAFDAKSFGIYLLKNDWKEAKAVSWEDLPKYGCSQLYSPEAEGIRKRTPIPCIETECNPSFLASYCENKFINKEFSSSYLLPLTYLKVP
ncbi:MAG TPA: tRNA (adenosine(37)-N6)-threonylcarbamoyltransferase complex dimerization subunit type 1 TsaB [Chlamydiales bacterium]|nr:tRNA (adenosine(37)-N6)-threonylcarbamoyltransferase complex dimerization subunit type 1 TsaB [Chlamydiales bacterium]